MRFWSVSTALLSLVPEVERPQACVVGHILDVIARRSLPRVCSFNGSEVEVPGQLGFPRWNKAGLGLFVNEC